MALVSEYFAMDHKKQHFVPASYLRAWCDVNSPANYKPYVWIFPKNGGEPKNKPPEKIFWETDFYTIKHVDGERDLNLEKGLSQLESQFTVLRQRKLSKRKPISDQEKSLLCTFVAAMYGRSKSRRDYLRGQWQQALDIGNKMAEWAENATPEQRNQMRTDANPTKNKMRSFNLDDIKKIIENPLPSFLKTVISMMAPALYKMHFAILDSSVDSTFITSDTPCVWFDPNSPGSLYSPSIEISLPLSPTQLIFFGRKLIFDDLYIPKALSSLVATTHRDMYIPIKADNPIIAPMNRRAWENADDFFIANQNSTIFSWLPSKSA